MDDVKDNMIHFKPRPRPEQEQRRPDGSTPIKVNANEFPSLKCVKCGSIVWEQALNMKIIPSVVSPTGNEEVAPVPTIICKKCGETVERTLESMKKPE